MGNSKRNSLCCNIKKFSKSEGVINVTKTSHMEKLCCKKCGIVWNGRVKVEAQHFKENSCCQNVCRSCGKVFASNCLLKLHLTDQKKCAGVRGQMKLMIGIKELEEKITCGICSKWFATKILLKHHPISNGNVSVKEEIMKGRIVCETWQDFPFHRLF